MFYSKTQAWDYYEELLEQEVEEEYYDSIAIKILGNFHATRGINWWEDTKENIESAVFQAKQQLGYMYKDAKRIDYEDYDDTMREQYNNQDDDFYEKYPTYEDWEDTEDYYQEISFIQEMEWNDFKENYEDELGYMGDFNGIHQLLSKLSDIEDEISGIADKISEMKDKVMRETIEACFED